jgi:hypothetical protein
MPKAEREEGDQELQELFERFDAQMVSPGGAAALLGLSRKTIYTLGKRGRIRVFHSSEKSRLSETGRIWAFIPIVDLARYAREVGRPFSEDLRLTVEARRSAEERSDPLQPGPEP